MYLQFYINDNGDKVYTTKVNCDASINSNYQRAGFGCVLRDDLENWIKGCNGLIPIPSVLRAELFAIWRGLLLVWECGFKDVICETDCLDAFLATRMMDLSRGDANRDLFSKIFEVIQWKWNAGIILKRLTEWRTC
ncbi:hypothetical protein PIB30_012565 [Stylosanthes scabra]|uniref:RNase H type-1 domain-containing protein n=1 Tax=Stylosanthes scabra TaxID=79078 RepID=A0ABU6W5N8_9FABA|nr:hypothetical protein [Stylosanthes scabra]